MPDPSAATVVITLPTDDLRQEFLKGKLAEYKARLDHTKHPENPLQGWDNLCKIAVLSRLLREGMVDCWALSIEFGQQYGRYLIERIDDFKRAFKNACSVISDYCETGGVHVHH